MTNLTLGLDLGTNSIGWALVGHDENGEPQNLEACGVRIFQEAVEAKTRTPKNHARRQARQARKLVARRKIRRDTLLKELVRQNMLPADESNRHALFSDDKERGPYSLRKRGLDEMLSLHEFGRVLFHLNRRRGFKSNRKAQLADLVKDPEISKLIEAEDKEALSGKKKPATDPDKDEGVIKAAITQLRNNMAAASCRTLGEYLWQQPKKRKLHTDRAMLEEEFEALWQSQQHHHPDTLTDGLRSRLFKIIFHQRPLKTQKFLVGRCPFEPSRKRAAKALLETQRFRILQDINHLVVKNPVTREFRPLTAEERRILLEKLHEQESMTWGKARKLLGLHEGEKFNLEEGGKEKLVGNRTVLSLRKALSDKWDALPKDRQKELLTDLLTIDRKDALIKRLRGPAWNLSAEEAYRLAIVELEPGYGNLSLKAINRLLPHLEAGLNYHDACQAAGYQRDDQKPKGNASSLPAPPNLRNPVVNKALHETRRVINAIVRKYGKPALIRVELARDMKLTRKEKERATKQNKENERANKEAAEQLYILGLIASPDPRLAKRDDLLKYRLWKESAGLCPYTGQSIGLNMLFGPEVDIEHIIPYSLSLDDSYMNKTLCMADFNRQVKKQQTPHEVFSGSPQQYQNLLQRLSHMPLMRPAKTKKFEVKEINPDDFVNRQLSDTRYISVEAKNYLQQLGIPVEISKGEATAALRHRWNLNRILAVDGVLEKNRADHRHHAIDAVVIAITSRALFHKLSRLSATSSVSLGERGFELDRPWPSFYEDVKDKIDSIFVSHAASRKITGALHEDTAYGYCEHDKCFVYRKPLASLTANEVEKIRDAKIKELVTRRVEDFGGDLKKALGNVENPLLHADGKTPIRAVRLAVNFDPATVHGMKRRDGAVYKFFKYGNNHHVEIIEHIHTGKRKGIFVTALEAVKRARVDKTAIVQRDHGPEWRFVMSLAVNDMVEIEHDNQRRYYRVQLLDGSNSVIALRLHTAATLDDKATRLFKTPSSLSCNKVNTDPLGCISPCND